MSKQTSQKPAMKWWLKSLVGLVIILATVWGGAYALHVAGNTWAMWPIWITGILFALIGLVIAVPSGLLS